jgi:catechol 2,3-dioxygenase-like lactoylglutathione lyase family enzyme
MENTKTGLLASIARGAVILTLVAPSLFAQSTSRPSDVVGMALVGHQVADLERSIRFYEALDFKVVDGPAKWKVDKDLNKLGNTPGAESRTATLTIASSVSDVPFTLILREYRGIKRQDWSTFKTSDLAGNHIDLTMDGSVSALLDSLEAKKMLNMPVMQGTISNARVQEGFRRYAFIWDPDGLLVEYFGKPIPKPGDPPSPPTISNSSATAQNVDRLGKHAGFNHYAVNVVDPEKSRSFYVKVLGGDYPPVEDPNARSVLQNGWYPQATTQNNMRIELCYFATNKGKTSPPMQFQDINANFVGFQVSNIDTAYARAKANGATTVTEGGIMKYNNGRAVVIRDSDVGGYILLWQPPK